MKEDICTIPVSEIFEKKDGCPFCRMYNMLEEHLVDYILGPAMMEVDVRASTNRLGFCARHYLLMTQQNDRLPLALTIESRLDEITSGISHHAGAHAQRCFLCERTEHSMSRLTDTFFRLWKNEAEFRALALAQPFYCLPHFEMLLTQGREALGRRGFGDFEKALAETERQSIAAVRADIARFCEMFDYRNVGAAGAPRDTVERAIRLLAGDTRFQTEKR
ncbi:MAG: DUF6062 family protein [Clostridia bacterium]|nr:DUF6062 family protein [Clostridia bacterium]